MKFIKFFFLTLLSIVMWSCVEDDLVYNNKLEIAFVSDYIGHISNTRATGDINNENVKNSSFYVYGQYYDGSYASASSFATIFDKQIVSHDGSNWTYTPIKYWDPKKSYTFTAVMPEQISTDDITYTDEHKMQIENIPLTQPILDQNEQPVGIDYLVSKSVDDHTSASGVVHLKFKHILSRFSVFVYTGDETANVTLNSMNIYLPKGFASYEEVNHEVPVSNIVDVNSVKQVGDKWTWAGFTNKVDGTNDTYQKYSLLTIPTPSVNVPYYNGIPSTDDAQLLPVEFFMAPIDNSKFATKEDLQLYMDLSFHVKYADGIEQDIVRTQPVLIHDLHAFTQNYRTNLFVKLLSENDIIAFNVSVEDFEGTTNHWVDHYGYSFDLVKYYQTVEDGTPNKEIAGILYDYGNVNEGDSQTKMTYKVKSLTKVGSTTPVATNLPMVFSKWSISENGTYDTATSDRTKDYPYGKFTVDLKDVTYDSGTYIMVVENSMGDVREYKVELSVLPYPYMQYTVIAQDMSSYGYPHVCAQLPFLPYEDCQEMFVETDLLANSAADKMALVYNHKTLDEVASTYATSYGMTFEEYKRARWGLPADIWIDWGDGSEEEFYTKGTLPGTEFNAIHNYTKAGKYVITITSKERNYTKGQVPVISWSGDPFIVEVNTPLLHYDMNETFVKDFGDLFKSDPQTWLASYGNAHPECGFSGACKGCISPVNSMFALTDIEKVHSDVFKYYPEATSFIYCFTQCHNLKSIPESIFKYAPNAEYFGYCFYQCDGITSIPAGIFDSQEGKNGYMTSIFCEWGDHEVHWAGRYRTFGKFANYSSITYGDVFETTTGIIPAWN